MIFRWLRNRRRRKILAGPFPDDWIKILKGNVWQYASLSNPEQAKLRDDLRLFIAEKHWEGCGGFDLTDEVRVTIAAYACLLGLGLDPDSYGHVMTILVYPEDYFAPERTYADGGLVRDELNNRAGEAWMRGPVILSWADVLSSGRDRGRGGNLVIHEFAHQLDMLNHEVDGTPPLRDGARIPEWREVMANEYDEFVRRVERGRRMLLDPYGATNIGEFFAVVTECFFEMPVRLQHDEPLLYAMFREYYGQDPAAWLSV
ncbi:MAG: M90 family metallopeptidase [Planctomycetota bacterium]